MAERTGGRFLQAAIAIDALVFAGIGVVCGASPRTAFAFLLHGDADELKETKLPAAAVADVCSRVLAGACFGIAIATAVAVPSSIPLSLRKYAAAIGSLVSCTLAVILAFSGLNLDAFNKATVGVTSAVLMVVALISCLALMAELYAANDEEAVPTMRQRSAVLPNVSSATLPKPGAAINDSDGEEAAAPGAPLLPEGAEAEPERKYGWRHLLGFARPEQRWITLGCVCLVFRLPFSLSIPHFISETIGALSDRDLDGARLQIALLLIAGTMDAVLDFWNFFLFGYAQQRLIRRLRCGLFGHLLSLDVSFFDRTGTGDLASRLQADTQEMGNDLTWVFRWFIEGVVRIVGIFMYMFLREWRLGLLTLAAVPVCAVVNKLYQDWLHKNASMVQRSLADANEVAFEVLCSVRTVFSFHNQSQECRRYDAFVEKWFKLNVKQTFWQSVYYMVIATFLINTCVTAGILLYGADLVMNHGMKTSVLVAFMLYQSMLQQWVSTLLNSFTNLIKSTGAGEKVFQLLDEPSKPVATLNLGGDSGAAGLVQLDGVSFRYPQRPESLALAGVSFVAEPGQTVALVGHSGAGKSTCFHMVENFYLPEAGRILLDGVAVNALSPKLLHSQVALVNQEPTLFTGTIWTNIVYSVLHERENLLEDLASDPELFAEYDARVRKAAADANAENFIRALPQGYDTEVGEKGAQLSGGQKQRVAIARALIQAPRVLLLDEATSALDAESEYLVQQALDRAREGRTTLVIAHRLSTVKNADRIVVFEKGRVIEQGTHEELLAKEHPPGVPCYRTLFTRQLCKDAVPSAAVAADT
eukprot:TRINITY_DN26272_c0_g1_i1.p1 TRINITY_DN26272_c0_g1~~TRINITY_DN26272_c0_g1_i1.p1  ORF type:complete len:815 (+),score=259.33 TRINITY_DN26272_c0_g1_i1:44-2488(+)